MNEALHHVGIWSRDLDAHIRFLIEVAGARLVSRVPFSDGSGERAFVEVAGSGSVRIELLKQDTMTDRPDVPAHMAHGYGAVVGVPHLCLAMDSVDRVEKTAAALGYACHHRFPAHGYREFEFGHVKALFVSGPDGVDYEFFEFAGPAERDGSGA
jgi:catechol 2,3-dioxygenase-like lactoylglutathione lyase family enzyme